MRHTLAKEGERSGTLVCLLAASANVGRRIAQQGGAGQWMFNLVSSDLYLSCAATVCVA